MVVRDVSDDMLVNIIALLEKRTRENQVTWRPTDDTDEYLWSGTNSSVSVRAWQDNEGDTNVVVKLFNGEGVEVAELRSTWPPIDELDDNPFNYQPGPNNKLLAKLHEAARRSALDIDAVLQGIMKDLGEM